MQWTQTKPTTDGFYWFSFGKEVKLPPVPVKVSSRQFGEGVFGLARREPMTEFDLEDGWWYGPIEAPPFEDAG